MSMSNPCYKCEKRHQACAVGCPEWAEYEQKRADKYEENKHRFEGESDYIQHIMQRKERNRKRLHGKE